MALLKAKTHLTYVLTALVMFLAAGCAGHGHGGHGHSDHGHGESETDPHEHRQVRLSAGQLADYGVRLESASGGSLELELELPGEVRINPDRLAHVVPAVPGIAVKVLKSEGESVRGGEALAVLNSRELSEQRSALIAAATRHELARRTHVREEKLWKEEISSERDYLEARRELDESRIALLDSRQRLEALGQDADPDIWDIDAASGLSEYPLTSPFGGTVIGKHLTLGEAVSGGEIAFTVADLSTVWVILDVYRQDLARVETGREVRLSADDARLEARGVISYVGPLIDRQTRTAQARVVLDNRDGRWMPGLFVTARVSVGRVELPLAVPSGALTTVHGLPSVFVRTGDGFEPRHVVTGRSDGKTVEIVEGLAAGETYAAEGAFILKSELEKESFAGDGHVH